RGGRDGSVTFNAIALDPRSSAVVDRFGGQADLVNGTIRAVGDPIGRFQEDPLRLLRAVRFASRLWFDIEPQTAAAIAAAAPALATISRERVRDEIEKLLLGPSPSRGIRLVCDLGLAGVSLPDLPRPRRLDNATTYGCATAAI